MSHLLPVIFKNLWRNPVRTWLTVLGVAVAVIIFTAVLSLDHGMKRMLRESSGDNTLVVFERYQGCPPLSKLPARHESEIAEVPGVARTTSTLFLLSTCATATDLVAVHGIRAESFRKFRDIRIESGQYAAFAEERAGAIVGARVAQRYGWKPGDAVSLEKLGNLSFTVRGIFRAPGDTLEETILVHRDYLEFASNLVGQTSWIFVEVTEGADKTTVAAEIDALFANSQSPTRTVPEEAFIASAISGITEVIQFSLWLGYAALGIVLVGVGNSIAMTVRDRVREIAILKTVGFRRRQVVFLVAGEGAVTATAGALGGALLVWGFLQWRTFSISVEGFSLAPYVSPASIAFAACVGLVIGACGALIPAIAASRKPAAAGLRDEG
ncbi:MAG: ABC transporter permease [Opitutales bacterium]|nr:ABC transporter permease [Opitutales bacterium]